MQQDIVDTKELLGLYEDIGPAAEEAFKRNSEAQQQAIALLDSWLRTKSKAEAEGFSFAPHGFKGWNTLYTQLQQVETNTNETTGALALLQERYELVDGKLVETDKTGKKATITLEQGFLQAAVAARSLFDMIDSGDVSLGNLLGIAGGVLSIFNPGAGALVSGFGAILPFDDPAKDANLAMAAATGLTPSISREMSRIEMLAYQGAARGATRGKHETSGGGLSVSFGNIVVQGGSPESAVAVGKAIEKKLDRLIKHKYSKVQTSDWRSRR